MTFVIPGFVGRRHCNINCNRSAYPVLFISSAFLDSFPSSTPWHKNDSC